MEEKTGTVRCMNIKDAVILVTGGSSGIGKALVDALTEEGANIISASRTEGIDVSDAAQVDACIGKIEQEHGRIDAVIHSAGCIEPLTESIGSLSLDTFETIRSVNFDALVYLAHRTLQGMEERGMGVFCVIGSGAAYKPHPHLPVYSATKAAALAFIRATGKALAERESGVRAFSVSPGGVNTQMREDLFGDAANQQSPEVVAACIVELLKDEAVSQGLDWQIRDGEVIAPA